MRLIWIQPWTACSPRETLSTSRCSFRWCALLLTCCLAGAGCSAQRFARKTANETADQLASQARAAADRGDATSAEYYLTAAVNTNPRDCEARLELSELLVEHGSLKDATDHLRRLIAQSPEDPRGYVRLARILHLQQDDTTAGELVDKALELDPENAEGWLLRARLERAHQSDSRALAACYRVLAVDPEQNDARLLAAEIHLEQGNLQQATPLLRSVLDGGSECPLHRAQASWLLGRCYALDGRWSDAAAALTAAVRVRESSATDWYDVAYAWYRAGDMPAARRAVDTALRIAPGNPEALKLSRLVDASVIRTASAEEDRAAVVDETSHASATNMPSAAMILQAH